MPPPHWGPRHVPWLGMEPTTLWFTGQCSIYWAMPVRARDVFLSQFHSSIFKTWTTSMALWCCFLSSFFFFLFWFLETFLFRSTCIVYQVSLAIAKMIERDIFIWCVYLFNRCTSDFYSFLNPYWKNPFLFPSTFNFRTLTDIKKECEIKFSQSPVEWRLALGHGLLLHFSVSRGLSVSAFTELWDYKLLLVPSPICSLLIISGTFQEVKPFPLMLSPQMPVMQCCIRDRTQR